MILFAHILREGFNECIHSKWSCCGNTCAGYPKQICKTLIHYIYMFISKERKATIGQRTNINSSLIGHYLPLWWRHSPFKLRYRNQKKHTTTGVCINTVVVCTDLSGKEPHTQVNVDKVVPWESLGGVMVSTLAWNAIRVDLILALGAVNPNLIPVPHDTSTVTWTNCALYGHWT